MSKNTTGAAALVAALVLAGCSPDGESTSEGVTSVTVTGPAVTLTAPAVTTTADTVTITPPPVTVEGPTVTETVPPVTVTVGAPAGVHQGAEAAISVTSDALGMLEALPVKGRAPKTGYDRGEFGAAWTDDNDTHGGRNGCDTRNDVLRRDLGALVIKPGTRGCVALSGTLLDRYTGEVLPFVRGEDSGSRIHIDHLVSLSNAWQTGAQQLAPRERQNLANDPLNLWAVSGSTNQQKGDGDAATWLPPNKSVRCDLVAHQIAVKAKYRLWVTHPEAEAMGRILSDCPDHPVPSSDHWATPATG